MRYSGRCELPQAAAVQEFRPLLIDSGVAAHWCAHALGQSVPGDPTDRGGARTRQWLLLESIASKATAGEARAVSRISPLIDIARRVTLAYRSNVPGQVGCDFQREEQRLSLPPITAFA